MGGIMNNERIDPYLHSYGLAKLIPVTDFVTAIDATDMRSWDKTLAKQLNVFVQADAATKESDISKKLKRSEFIFPLAAMRYMLQTNNIELLKKYVVQGDATSLTIPNRAHQLFVRMLGYQITGNIDNVVISQIPAL